MSFAPLLGNSRIKSALKRRQIAAPVILEGPEGSGRKTAAFYLAAGLLCTGNASGHGKPCFACGSCARMSALSHPDCHILAYEGKQIKIEQIRELRSHAFIKPQEADSKVFIIHEADKLSEQCQNALLKVLEEGRSSIFLLTVSSSATLLRTVRSRCIVYCMEALDEATLERELSALGSKSGIAAAIAQSDGYLGRARAFLSGSEPEWLTMARSIARALDVSELDLFSAVSDAEKLTREQYPLFLDCLCDVIMDKARNGDAKYISIYEYICSQKEMLPHNPGVAALTGALAAFCGACVFGERGQAI